MGRYQEISHTADWAIRIWVRDFQDGLETLRDALLDYFRIPFQEGNEPLTWEGEGDEVDVMVQCANEFLYLLQYQKKGIGKIIEVKREGMWKVTWLVYPIEGVCGEIKACTYHGAKWKEVPGGWEVTLTFDV